MGRAKPWMNDARLYSTAGVANSCFQVFKIVRALLLMASGERYLVMFPEDHSCQSAQNCSTSAATMWNFKPLVLLTKYNAWDSALTSGSHQWYSPTISPAAFAPSTCERSMVSTV